MKGNSNLGLLCVVPTASERSDLQAEMEKSVFRKAGVIAEKKTTKIPSAGFPPFSDCNRFFFLKFFFRSDQEQTHNTDTQTLNFSTHYFPTQVFIKSLSERNLTLEVVADE